MDESSSSSDWRAFRAKLVLQEKGNDLATAALHEDHRWIHEQTILETGSVLIHTPRPQDSSLLGKQCLYRSVVLVIEVQPEETIGIILNRPTNIACDDTVIHYGGDEHSVHSDDDSRAYVLQSSSARGGSIPILPGLSLTSIDEMMASNDDDDDQSATIYSGHVAWPTNELLNEMERGIWKCLSVDSKTITMTDPNTLLERCGVVDTILPSTFDQRMFHEWSQIHLTAAQGDECSTVDACGGTVKKKEQIQTGDMIRTACTDHSFLFSDQEFYQSIMIVLQEDEDFTVVVLLNHATTMTSQLLLNDDDPLPVRHGGSFRHDEHSTELPPFCIHFLGDAVVDGEHVGGDVFFKSSLNQAAAAIERGLACRDDFLVVQGMTVWPKDEFEFNDCFEVVDPGTVPAIWKLLAAQERLSPATMDGNVNVAREAWNLAGPSNNSELADLGADAVKMWVAAHLLEDPTYRPS